MHVWVCTCVVLGGCRAECSQPYGAVPLPFAGCDALAAGMIILPYAALLQLGHYKALWLCMSALVPFFLAQWEEYHLHVLRTNVGGVGMTVAPCVCDLTTSRYAHQRCHPCRVLLQVCLRASTLPLRCGASVRCCRTRFGATSCLPCSVRGTGKGAFSIASRCAPGLLCRRRNLDQCPMPMLCCTGIPFTLGELIVLGTSCVTVSMTASFLFNVAVTRKKVWVPYWDALRTMLCHVACWCVGVRQPAAGGAASSRSVGCGSCRCGDLHGHAIAR